MPKDKPCCSEWCASCAPEDFEIGAKAKRAVVNEFMVEVDKLFADFTADLSMHAANVSLDKEERRASEAKLSVLAFMYDQLKEKARRFNGND